MKCEKCNKQHDGTFGSGRFCSRSCANSRNWNESDNHKKSISAKKSNAVKSVNKKRRVDRISKKCPMCNTDFEIRITESQTYCNKKCYLDDTELKYRTTGSGGYRKGSGRGKGGWYRGIWCDSTWELAYVIYCLDMKIKLKRNNRKFKYMFNNEEHYYIPDFIVDEKYVEVKGYISKQWNSKLKQFPVEIEVLYKEDLKEIFDHVEKKYGKNYIELYEGNPHKLRNNKCKVCGNPAVNMYCSRLCSGLSNKGNKHTKQTRNKIKKKVKQYYENMAR